MKSIILLLGLISVASACTAEAGTYDFKCTAYSMDTKTSAISKLEIGRFEAFLDGINLKALDVNASISEGAQISYQSADKKTQAEIRINSISPVVNLAGLIGPRDHEVSMFTANIEAKIDGKLSKTFTGFCSTVEISSCGGVFPCPVWAKWQGQP